MPVYNSAQFLAEALDSALSQTLEDILVICIDDGSTDSSRDILHSYAQKDKRIHTIFNKHAGVCAARNSGIDYALQAGARFITFLDSDDFYYDEHFLKACYECAILYNQQVAGAPLFNFRAPNSFETQFDHPLYRDYIFNGDYLTEDSGIVSFADYQWDYGFTRHIYSSELFEGNRHRFGTLRFFEDTTWMVNILYEAETFAATKQSAYVYRCDYRPISWSTEKILDLITGVGINLDFSNEHEYAKLHWQTVHHFDEAAHYAGVGLMDDLDTQAIDEALTVVEQKINRNLLVQIEPKDCDYVFSMRKSIAAALNMSPSKRAIQSQIFKTKRSLTPLYHRLTR